MGRMKEIPAQSVHIVSVTGDDIRPMKTISGGSGRSVPVYPGPTEFTPSTQRQTIAVSGYRLTENITIDPIPTNYGLITWNGAGSVITVS